MSAADKDPDKHSADADPPLTVELLADLQAGLLDDATAARIRSRVRSDPQAQQILRALNRVRRDVAAMGADPAWGQLLAQRSSTAFRRPYGRRARTAHPAPLTPPVRTSTPSE
ncbi:anti-sigma-M factor RsmA [Mycobacterium tuberculosis variant bovis BCG]|nr:anti-sigma-M factor RsmA [Mycobacterium tuberculosis variant bovis BCG]AMC66535.1 anti-sigma-M factor RsmA [Mycobacterium tuberculosis variant africanum]AMC75599.1 anti-sigma-M factor RsmA [Mycobacterium tuberculosis]